MKKILMTLAILAMAGVSNAADSYLYWMMTDQPGKGTPSGATYDSYYASVRVSGTDNYLTFANSGADVVEAVANERHMVSLAGVAEASSFIVELWNECSTVEPSFVTSAMSYQDLAQYITTGVDGHVNPLVLTASSFHAVPEPTSGMMLLVGAMLLGLKRKRVIA